MVALEMHLLATRLGGDASALQDFTAMTVHCESAQRTATVAASAIIIQANALVTLDTRELPAKKYVAQRIAGVRTNSGSAILLLDAVHAHLQATARLVSICSVLVTVLRPPVVAVTVLQDGAIANQIDFLRTARVGSVDTMLLRSPL